jgi:penicillin-binding protein 1A
MGRDDNKAIPGLQGGRAPARAFHDFMARAVANRPPEPFETQVAQPDWAEPDEEVWFGAPDNGQDQFVDPDGNPAPAPLPGERPEPAVPPSGAETPRPPEEPAEDELDRAWLDRAINREDEERAARRRERQLERERERERRREERAREEGFDAR